MWHAPSPPPPPLTKYCATKHLELIGACTSIEAPPPPPLYGCALLKVWSTIKIRRTRVPQNAIVPVGRPMPYSIIILNMRFIPKASLRASSQISASSYILERHLWVKNSKPFALTPTWSLACKQTDCITAGMWKLPDSEHKTFVWLYAMLDQRRRRWAAVV